MAAGDTLAPAPPVTLPPEAATGADSVQTLPPAGIVITRRHALRLGVVIGVLALAGLAIWRPWLTTEKVQALAVLPFNFARIEPWLVWVLIGVAGGGLVAGGLVLEGRLLRRLTGWLPPALSLAGQGPLAKVYAAVTGCGRRPVLSAFGVSVFFNLVNVLINWLCGQAVGAGVGLSYFFVATPLLSVAGLIPSIGGWGVREASFQAFAEEARKQARGNWRAAYTAPAIIRYFREGFARAK